MKIYLLIKPWDYSFADVIPFKSREDAEAELRQGLDDKEKNSEYWVIREEKI